MEMLNDYISSNTNMIILGLCCINLIIIILLIANSVKIKKWKKKYYKFMNANNDFNIEDVLKENINNIDNIKSELIKQKMNIEELEKHVKISIEKVSLIKYNAFENMGGQLSFVLAFLNQENSGILINGMHSREGCYTYVKEIIDGKCNKVLSNEEKDALEKAINSGI
ncbi:MAG: DUF4446 family protein [Vallitalea sp.]|jgi:hypothetical protein|nr:DUF4446 family protein [Vallitalea sp.]